MNVFISLYNKNMIEAGLTRLQAHKKQAEFKKKDAAYQARVELLIQGLENQKETVETYGIGKLSWAIPESRKLIVNASDPLTGLHTLYNELVKQEIEFSYTVKPSDKITYIGFDGVRENISRLFMLNACTNSTLPFEFLQQPVQVFYPDANPEVIIASQDRLVTAKPEEHGLTQQVYQTLDMLVGLDSVWDLQVLIALSVRMGIYSSWQTSST